MKLLSLKNNYITILISFLLLIILFSCNKEPIKTYYEFKGRGYIFDTVNNAPYTNAKVTIQSVVEGENSIYSSTNPEIETYYTDFNGYYEVPFLKKYGSLKIAWYYIEIHYNIDGSDNLEVYEVKAEEVKNAKNNILFDPILISGNDAKNSW